MTIDAHGGIHDSRGRFDGHLHAEGDTSEVLPPPEDDQWWVMADADVLRRLEESRANPRKPYVRARIPLACLIAEIDAMQDTLDLGVPSDTPHDPILVRCRDDMTGRFELADGHHRVAAALRRGERFVEAEIDPLVDDEPYEPPFFRFPRP